MCNQCRFSSGGSTSRSLDFYNTTKASLCSCILINVICFTKTYLLILIYFFNTSNASMGRTKLCRGRIWSAGHSLPALILAHSHKCECQLINTDRRTTRYSFKLDQIPSNLNAAYSTDDKGSWENKGLLNEKNKTKTCEYSLLDLVAAVRTSKVDDELQLLACVIHKLALQTTLLCFCGPHKPLIEIQQAVQ